MERNAWEEMKEEQMKLSTVEAIVDEKCGAKKISKGNGRGNDKEISKVKRIRTKLWEN